MPVSAHSCILEAIPYARWFYPGSLGTDYALPSRRRYTCWSGAVRPGAVGFPGTGDQVCTVLGVVPEGCC